jgi:hydrogenase expression/formation protein HypE
MRLACPIPTFNFSKITLGHGSGGKLTHELLQNGVFSILENEWLNQQHDGAVFQLDGKLAFTTDSYVVSPPFFPGGNIGDLAVNGTVNDLAMCGAMAKYLSLSFIFEEGLSVETFSAILMSIKKAADKAGVHIVTGDTKVVEKGKGDQLFINTSGIGIVHPLANINYSRIEDGDQIIINGPIAAHGIAVMSIRKGLEFETTIKSDTASLNNTIYSLLDHFGEQIKFLRDPTRGGVASVLNEIAALSNLSFMIHQDRIPVDEQVEGACEMLGLDPLYVANEGLFIAIVKKEISNEVVAFINSLEENEHAAIIGEVIREQPGKVILKSHVGGKRVIGLLPGDQLPRIC